MEQINISDFLQGKKQSEYEKNDFLSKLQDAVM